MSNVSLTFPACAGSYCARLNPLAQCGPCPAGFRSVDSACIPCTESASLYSWMYFGFMALVPVLINMCCVYRAAPITSASKHVLILEAVCLLESVVSGLSTLLVVPPVGSLNFHVCNVNNISDWYPLFYNPVNFVNLESLNFTSIDGISCSHEVVYPLFSMILIYYGFSVLTLLFFRVPAFKLVETRRRYGIYCSLFMYPIITIAHILFSGVFYYAFPYILLLGTLVSQAVFLVGQTENFRQTPLKVFKATFLMPTPFLILLVHWIFLILSLLSITEAYPPVLIGTLSFTAPLPYIFYVLTLPFSHPDAINLSGEDHD